MSKAKAEISFYQLKTHPLEKVLPKLLEKIYNSQLRALVVAGSPERAQILNASLWTYSSGAFLPHGMAGDNTTAPQDNPIWITVNGVNENKASVLVLTDGRLVEDLSDYDRCVDIFDGNIPSSLDAANRRREAYGQKGHPIIYWQQSIDGTWSQGRA